MTPCIEKATVANYNLSRSSCLKVNGIADVAAVADADIAQWQRQPHTPSKHHPSTEFLEEQRAGGAE
jgi:hypothetical protein